MGWTPDNTQPRDEKAIFLAALLLRLLARVLTPVDWNPDSYHHWQISYLSLHLGFKEWRLWDLLGCEYYWGMLPHLTQAALMGALKTPNIDTYRSLNTILGGLNAVLIYRVGRQYYSRRNGLISGLSYAALPLAVWFDSVAMQDTMALALVLGSLTIFRDRYFWSGVLLGLACHTRVEYTVASALVLAGFLLRERLYTDSQPFLIGWLTAWAIPSLHIYLQTGNPFYPVYWGLYSYLGGFTSKYRGQPFLSVFSGWLRARPQIWLGSAWGVLLIATVAVTVVAIPYMALRKWYRYQPQLYAVSALATTAPLFLPYLAVGGEPLRLMARFAIPPIALGLPVFTHLLTRLQNVEGWGKASRAFSAALPVGLLALNLVAAPHYMGLQGTVEAEFQVADQAARHYRGGTVVCDIPSMVYRLVTRWEVEPGSLLSNLYGPHYYGVLEPQAYLEWLDQNNVTLWMYYGERGDPVWAVLGGYPGLLKPLFGEPRRGTYQVDPSLLDSLL